MTLADTTSRSPSIAVCVDGMHIVAAGSREEFDRVIHPDAVNREAVAEPPAARQQGPAAFYAAAVWLRSAFSDLRFEVHEAVEQGDMVVLHSTMFGRHTGDFVTYRPDATVEAAMPPTGKTFAVSHTHWFRVRDGLVIEHWANRDDLDMAKQAGWIPPSPRFLLRAAIAKRRATRRST